MHAGGGAEGVTAHQWIVDGYLDLGGLGNESAVLHKMGDVVVVGAHQLQIDDDLVDGGVANAFTDAQGRAVDSVGAVLKREERVGHTKTAVVVTVPVDLHVFASGDDEIAGPVDEIGDAVRSHVADRVAQDQSTTAQGDGVAKQPVEGLWRRAGCVLGDKRDVETVFDGERDGLVGGPQQAIHVPVLGEHADRAGAQERVGADGHAGFVAHPHDGFDVLDHRTCRAGGTNGKALITNMDGESFDVVNGPLTGTGQANVGHRDAELVHQFDELLFDLDGRIHHRRTLDAISQRLVTQLNRLREHLASAPDLVPVVDEVGV